MKNKVEKPIPVMQEEIEEFVNRIEEQITINKKIKRNRWILITVTFAIVTVAVIASKIYFSSVYDKRLEEYHTYTENKIEEYEQALDSMNE